VEYKARKLRSITTAGNEGNMDTDHDTLSGFDTRQVQTATDFELPDYWDEGEVLDGRQHWPVCITLNRVLEHSFLDATPQEEAAISLRLLLMFSFDSKHAANLHGVRMLGNSELTFHQLSSLIADGEKHAREIYHSLNAKLKDEDLRRNEKAREKFAQR